MQTVVVDITNSSCKCQIVANSLVVKSQISTSESSLLVVQINLVSMQDMQKTTFLVLMHMEKHGDVAKVERASPYPFCIS
jgi:hypothetical protein